MECFFNRHRQFRRLATRYDKLAHNFVSLLNFACFRLHGRVEEAERAGEVARITRFGTLRSVEAPASTATTA